MIVNGRPAEDILYEIDARQQIHDAVLRYCRGMDHREPGLALSAYHPGARDEHGFYNGSAEDFVAAGMAASDDFEVIRHVICNEYVEFDPDDRTVARAETVTIGCILTRDAEAAEGYRLSISSCRFLDRFELREGTWKIAERRLVLDWEMEGPARGLAGGPLTTGMLRGFASTADPSFALGFRHWGEGALLPVREERVGMAAAR